MIKFILITISITLIACGSKEDNLKKKEKKNESKTTQVRSENSALSWYDIENEGVPAVSLPDELKEISGITFTSDNRLFAHGDEDGDVYQLNPETGQIIKRFALGDMLVVKGDFEDITYAKDRFYLVVSKGSLYEFNEAENGKFVTYKKYGTFLNSSNDVEGLCYDNSTNSLLLVCKGSPGEGYDKQKAVYSFSLSSNSLEEKPRFLIDLKTIKSNTVENEFSPSGIAKHPSFASFFIIAAKGNTIIEIDEKGALINQKNLPKDIHKQPEGIAFMKDGTLFISNEDKNKTPVLIKYKLNK